jgi:hypothetical protein
MLRNALFTLVLATFSFPFAVSADTLLVEGIDTTEAGSDQHPSRGLSMDKVRAQWGDPAANAPAIGDPPITRWEYNGFVVYFEYDIVLHTVVRRKAP